MRASIITLSVGLTLGTGCAESNGSDIARWEATATEESYFYFRCGATGSDVSASTLMARAAAW